MKAIVLERYGGSGELQARDLEPPKPGAGQILVKLDYAGVNFIDIYFRTGLYPLPAFPAILGKEGAGEVVALGPGVKRFVLGDRLAYPFSDSGSYSEYALVSEDKAALVPEGVALETAAAIMLQGLTAHYLLFSTYNAQAGDRVLIHAAAGGVGLLMTQIAALKGCRVLTTVSSPEKRDLALAAGADEVIIYENYIFADRVLELTEGKGVDVVYDSVAKATFEESLRCLKPRGLLALFGNSSGALAPFDLGRLNPAGSLFITRPTLAHYIQDAAELQMRLDYLFALLRKDLLKVKIGGVYPLAEVGRAHDDLEQRKTSGKLLLKM